MGWALLGAAVLAAGFLLWLNGPGFRWALGTYLPRFLEERQGLDGGIGRVEGTLMKGATLSDVAFKEIGQGGSVLRHLKAGRIAVRYRLRDFLDDRPLQALDAIELADVDAEIHLPAASPTPKDEEDKQDEGPLGEAGHWREIVWQVLRVRLLLDDVTVRIHRSDDVWGIEHLSIDLPGFGDGGVQVEEIDFPDGSERGAFAARTSATDDSFSIRGLQVVEGVAVEEASLLRTDEPLARGRIRAFGAAFDLACRTDGTLRLSMGDGRFDLPSALRTFDVEDVESAVVTEFLAELTLGSGFPGSWDWAIDAAVEDIRYSQAVLASARLHASSAGGRIDAEVRAVPDNGSIVLAAETDWSGVEDVAGIKGRPISGSLVIAVPEVAGIIPQKEIADRIDGGVDADLSFRLDEFRPVDLEGEVRSTSLRYEGIAVDSIVGRFSAESPDEIRVDADIALDPENSLRVEGNVRPDELGYNGTGTAKLTANSRIGELLRMVGARETASGSVTIEWTGNGSIMENRNEGEAKVTLRQGQYGESAPPADLDASIRYAPGSVLLDELMVDFGTFSGGANIRWQDERLDVAGLRVTADNQVLATGSVSVPLALAAATGGLEGLLAQEGPLDLELMVPPITLARVGDLLGRTIPVEATTTVDLSIGGTLQSPSGGGTVGVAGLRLPAAERLQAADAQVDLRFADGATTVNGSIRHPEIQPVSVSASAAFRPQQWATKGFDASKEQFTASFRMPPSSLAFLTDYAPAIETIDGNAAIDLRAEGSLDNPGLVGSITVDVPRLRPRSQAIPAARDVRGRIAFSGRRMTIEQLEAVVTGGRIGITGAVDSSSDLRNPSLDIKISASEALIARTRELNLRCDADLAIAGTWRTAEVKGEIGLRGGRFAKTFDLIPARLGAGTSKLPEVERPEQVARARIELGTDLEPFKDWTVDLLVRSEEPFLVRTNLGRADIVVNTRIGGSGAMLVPGGTIQATDGVVLLPFSDITLSKAELRFSDTTRFNPVLAVDGRAEVADYRISLFGYGTVTKPKVVLTSSPPLPQEDIISLLSTGATTSTLTGGNGTVALSQAAMFLLDDLTGSSQRGAEDSLRKALRTKVRIEPGQIDQRTGDTMVGGRVDLWKGFSFVGSMGLEGHYRALFRYVFRFR